MASTTDALNELEFPRYPKLQPAVGFWTQIFGQYSENQSIVHSSEHPALVYEVLDFREQAQRLSATELARVRASAERQSKARVDELLRQVQRLRTTPEKMNAEQRRVFEMFKDVPGDNRFQAAIGSFRAQRGLKERTALALETSGKYLPAMESTFQGYSLPPVLTRLPLVESSFNVDAYSKVGAAGLWQFMPSSAKIYMRLDEVVDDRRDPWTSTDAAARHLRDDYAMLQSWPLALTAYNHGRAGISRALKAVKGETLVDIIDHYESRRFGFASRNFYAEFLAAADVERDWRTHFGELKRNDPLRFEVVETKNYVPYETLRSLCNADDELFRRLNPAYRPEVIQGKLYVPPGHLIRVPAGSAQSFQVAYAKLGSNEVFSAQKVYFLLHKVRSGDTLSGIAHRYASSQSAIAQANGLRDKSYLRIGQVLKIPPHEERRPGPITVAVGESKPGLTRAESAATRAGRTESAPAYRAHKVQQGQTLIYLAKRYDVSVASIREANQMGGSSLIRVGQRLRIPAS